VEGNRGGHFMGNGVRPNYTPHTRKIQTGLNTEGKRPHGINGTGERDLRWIKEGPPPLGGPRKIEGIQE